MTLPVVECQGDPAFGRRGVAKPLDQVSARSDVLLLSGREPRLKSLGARVQADGLTVLPIDLEYSDK